MSHWSGGESTHRYRERDGTMVRPARMAEIPRLKTPRPDAWRRIEVGWKTSGACHRVKACGSDFASNSGVPQKNDV